MEKSDPGPSHGQRRVRITEPEKALVLQCYEEKSGQSWENVLQHVKKNLDSLPLSSPVVKFYLEQESQQAINRIRRTVRSQLKAASESSTPVSGPMSGILASKTRYAKKISPEDRCKTKLSHMSTDISGESSFDEESSVQEVVKKAESESPKEKRKRSKGKGKRKAEDAHVAMCNKAMATVDKMNKLLDKYAAGSSSSSE